MDQTDKTPIVQSSPHFSVLEHDKGIRIVSKLVQPYKVMDMSYENAREFLTLLEGFFNTVIENLPPESTFTPVKFVEPKY